MTRVTCSREYQQQVATETVEHGYYDTLRECTLVELAKAFNVDKSPVGKVLWRAESCLIEEFVAKVIP